MSSLPDAERDALDVLQTLAGLVALLQRDDLPDRDGLRDTRRLLLSLAENGAEPATRVLAYLRELRGPGDGEATVVPPHLGPWREWTPSRGHLLGSCLRRPELGEFRRQQRRTDPGE